MFLWPLSKGDTWYSISIEMYFPGGKESGNSFPGTTFQLDIWTLEVVGLMGFQKSTYVLSRDELGLVGFQKSLGFSIYRYLAIEATSGSDFLIDRAHLNYKITVESSISVKMDLWGFKNHRFTYYRTAWLSFSGMYLFQWNIFKIIQHNTHTHIGIIPCVHTWLANETENEIQSFTWLPNLHLLNLSQWIS